MNSKKEVLMQEENKMVKNDQAQKYWKTIAIIFICLFVIETFICIVLFYIGTQALREEGACSSYCYNESSDSFLYDEFTKQCYCYNDNELISLKDINNIT